MEEARQLTSINSIDKSPMPPGEGDPPVAERDHEGACSVNGRRWWATLLEWGLIGFLILLYCWPILDLRADTRLTGNEAEVFQSLDWTLVNSLSEYNRFPLWNPYIHTGIPYIADPMLHVYNPVVTAPVLLFGVRAGFKLGIFLSFLIAAFGMWWLAKILGMASPVRVWMALMVTFAGQPAARFFQGQYLFILGFAWIPWILASLIQVTRTRRHLYTALSVIFLALLFFSGNAYYPFFMFVALVTFCLVMLVSFKERFPFLGLDTSLLKMFLLIGILALGVIAIQLFPLVEFWPRMNKDLHLSGSHTLKQIFLDYTSKDSSREDAYSLLPAREEFYAYIGLTPFLALILLPLAFWKHDRRLLIFFILLILFTVLWISLEFLPWLETFMQTRFLLQFRHLLRILIIGSFSLIALAGFGLDSLWKIFKNRLSGAGSPAGEIISYLAYLGLIALGIFMLFGVWDVFSTNRKIVKTQEIDQSAYTVMDWLSGYDQADYYIRHNPTNGWQEPIISAKQRFIDAWYHFVDIRDLQHAENQRTVLAQPAYVTQASDLPLPGAPGAMLLWQSEGYNVYFLPESLPLAFTVMNAELDSPREAGLLGRHNIEAITPFFSGPNDVELIAAGRDNQTLVVLITHYPGWQVKIDSQNAPLKNIGGYLAVNVSPGVHKYVFTFQPFSFYMGLAISMFSLAITLVLLIGDLRESGCAIKTRVAAGLDRLKGVFAGPFAGSALSAEAVYKDGVLQPVHKIDLANETRVRIIWEEVGQPNRATWQSWAASSADLLRIGTRSIPLDIVLFGLGLLVYLFVRLIGLTNYPIYFFSDEAVQTVLAADFIRDDFYSFEDELLPTYFYNVDKYSLSTTVYMQVLPYLMFGKSAWVTRAISVLLTLLAAISVGLILRDVLNLPFWWSGILVLSVLPAWFLHSRTAFETVTMVSFYTVGLYYYLLYRYKSPSYLYLAITFYALAFYSYNPGQIVVAATAVLLLASDARYHWQNRVTVFRGLGLAAFLALPYVRFRINHPSAIEDHLTTLGSYWVLPMSWGGKFGKFFREYLYGLSPQYWFFRNDRDLSRHLVLGFGHLHWLSLPFSLFGLAIVIKNYRSSAHRAVLVCLLAAPVGAALVHIAVTRALVIVVPATLLIAIGINASFVWLEGKGASRALASWSLFGILTLLNLAMLWNVLRRGPTWYDDYGLSGMQYGGAQVFQAVDEYLEDNPGAQVVVSPSWANGADVVARFFLPDPLPIGLGSIDDYMFHYLPIDDEKVFVMTSDEYERASTSGKFADIRVERTVPYPNGQIGFYFVGIKYVDNIQEILEAEKLARRQLQESEAILDDQVVKIRHSMLDMGSVQEFWDGLPHTVVRTFEANPFIIEMNFPNPRNMSGISMIIGDTEVEVLARFYGSENSQPVEYRGKFKGSVQEPEVTFDFGENQSAKKLYLEVKDLRQSDPGHVHIWEIRFLSGSD